ncbi:MAG: tetratricopeptide repeat protein [Chloroflexi bacterium]|uniref:tetratricopeptide repeat protein n=1 Tax=Candidatus Flexifilum breve TaxID=3140694 RepID=UPI003136FC96|nr:tetratricopeptide repeat protein [Chloroflexota bacterium]
MQLNSLLSFLPIDRRHSLARGMSIPSSAAGSVLFADISGFTPLTEALARALGPRLGAEELTRQLNRVYDALIRQMDRFGGTITNFNGDALTCWFPSGDGSLREAAQRALTCAFGLQDAMQTFAEVSLPNGETASLSLKVAVATGKVQRFLVGDPGVLCLDVLAGETLNRMAQGERHAARGEVVIDEATANVLFQACEVTEWRQNEDTTYRFAVIRALTSAAEPAPWPELPPDALTANAIRSWIIPALLQREDALLTELRPTVALFCAFTGIDYDGDPDAERKLDAYVRWVQSIVTGYDGTLLQVTAADKGSHFYAAFGAPTAHENNAVRAASAALDLRKLPIELSYIHSVRIGLAQGIARTGAYGGETRRVYSVIGDAVNLAARLMTNAASGTVLITDRVQRAVAAEFITDPLTPIQVKGRSEPLPVARLVAYAEPGTVQPVRPLVGRSAELAHLLGAIAPIIDGLPVGATWVYGEAGIGKTHLITAAREHLGAAITWYRFPTDQLVHESLHAVMPVLHDYFSFFLAINDILKKKLFERRLDRLIRGLSEHPAMIAALNEARWYLGALLGLHWPNSPFESADPHVRFERSLTAINTLFQAESLVKPLVLHVQDAQWLDPDSRTVLELWIESAANYPLAVLIDSRELDHTVADRHAITLFPVRELDRGGVTALAATLLNGKVSASTVAYLLSKANGNPFFTEQLTLDLHERGALTSANGEWTLTDADIDDMPVNLNAVLIARLDRLSPALRTAVQVASVLGQEFDVPVLEQMSSESDVREKVKQAADEAIWVAQSETHFIFRHALLRDAAYSMQLQERLRELHARAGAAIEHVHADNMIVKAPDLAYHYEKAGTADRAIYYCIQSAHYMLSLHANHEAIGYYERALLIAEGERFPPSEIAPLYEGLGDLHEAAGAYQAAHTAYAAGMRVLARADYATWRIRLQRKQGQVLHKWGRYTEATQCYELGLAEQPTELPPEEACLLYLGLSQIHYRQGELAEAQAVAQLGLRMAQAQDDQRNLAYALQTLGMIAWKQDDYAQAMRCYTESLDLWQASKNPAGLAGIHNNLGLLFQRLGNLAQAIDHLQQAQALFEQVGNLHGLACVYDNLGQAYMQSGDETSAMTALEQAVSILMQIGLDESQVFTGMWQAGTW